MIIQHFVRQIMTDQTLPCHLLERILYKIFLKACGRETNLKIRFRQWKRKRKRSAGVTTGKGIPVQSYVNLICGDSLETDDVLLLTGVGDVFPFMRIHKLLEALQPKVGNVPILVMSSGRL